HGRTHFEHRSALLVAGIEELRQELADLMAGRPGPDVWLGEPLVLPARDGADADLARLIESAAHAHGAERARLREIAACYLRGGDGPWEKLFPRNCRRLGIPGYRF